MLTQPSETTWETTCQNSSTKMASRWCSTMAPMLNSTPLNKKKVWGGMDGANNSQPMPRVFSSPITSTMQKNMLTLTLSWKGATKSSCLSMSAWKNLPTSLAMAKTTSKNCSMTLRDTTRWNIRNTTNGTNGGASSRTRSLISLQDSKNWATMVSSSQRKSTNTRM